MKRKGLFLFLLLTFMVCSFFLGVWTSRAESRAHYTPECPRVDLAGILENSAPKELAEAAAAAAKELSGDGAGRKALSEEDYRLILAQTGMGRRGVDELYARGEEDKLLYLQERLFAPVEIECQRGNFLVQFERIAEEGILGQGEGGTAEVLAVSGNMDGEAARDFLPAVQDGDILISFSGHIFGWRYGHAAIVVDAERGLTVEAVDLGTKSKLRPLEHWREYPGFAVLRLKGFDVKVRRAIAAYVKDNLVGLPYSLVPLETMEKTESYWSRGRAAVHWEEALTGTHCAHLVWYAYQKFGFDLDSDGGLVVTPADLCASDLLELIQIYGLNPEDAPCNCE